MNILNAILIAVLVICLVTDIRERKIYNKVIFPSLFLTFILQGWMFGGEGLLHSISGFFVGLGILLIPYLLGGMGAGDVKLLALIGAIKGTAFVVNTAILMGLVGGVIALGILLFRKGVFVRLKSIVYTICGIRYGLKIPLGIGKDDYQTTYPYGVAIALGAFLAMLSSGGMLL